MYLQVLVLTTIFGQAPATPKPAAQVSLYDRWELRRPVNLRHESGPVKYALRSLSRQLGVSLEASKEMADEPVIVFAKRRMAADVMRAIAGLYRAEWVEEEIGSNLVVKLRRPPEVLSATKREQEEWRRKRAALKSGRDRMVSGMLSKLTEYAAMSPDEQEASQKSDPYLASGVIRQGNALPGLLAQLDPQERAALVEQTQRPFGFIVPGPNGTNLRNMVATTPLSDLPDSTQAQIREFAGIGQSGASLDGAQVGIIAYYGSLGVAIKQGGQLINAIPLMLPQHPDEYESAVGFWTAQANGEDADWKDWLDPENRRALAEKYGEEPSDAEIANSVQLGLTTGRIRIQTSGMKERRRLASFLSAIHDQTGLTVVGDELWRTSNSAVGLNLAREREHSLREACTRLAVRFKRRIRLSDQILKVSSYRYAIDKLYEIPFDLLKPFEHKKRRDGRLSFGDLVTLHASLTPEQLASIQEARLGTSLLVPEADLLVRYGSAFRIWQAITDNQRRDIHAKGLLLASLPSSAQRDFWALSALGSSVNRQPDSQGPRIWIVSQSDRIRVHVATGSRLRPYVELDIPFPAVALAALGPNSESVRRE